MLKLPKTAIIKANTKSTNSSANEIWKTCRYIAKKTDKRRTTTKRAREHISKNLILRNLVKLTASFRNQI
jgi:hypothetical protein